MDGPGATQRFEAPGEPGARRVGKAKRAHAFSTVVVRVGTARFPRLCPPYAILRYALYVNRPLLLLLGTGAMLGLNFPLGKLAIAAGVEPALWAALISLGAGLAMWIVTRVTEREGGNLLPLWEKVAPRSARGRVWGI